MQKEINKKDKIEFYIITILVCMTLLVALMAPLIAPNDPNEVNLMSAQILSNNKYPLGTDALGRCMFSRILYGGRVSIFSGLTITFIVFIVGTVIGVIAGYFGKTVDIILNKLITIMQAFPKIILAIAIAGLLGMGIKNIIFALCMVEWAEYARIARSYTYSIKQRNFIKAARICGESHIKIIFKRIIPNIIFPLIVNASLGISGIIMGIAALSYLGVGVKEPMIEWGAMINTGRNYMQTDIRQILIPSIALFGTSAIFNLFGEKLRDKLI